MKSAADRASVAEVETLRPEVLAPVGRQLSRAVSSKRARSS